MTDVRDLKKKLSLEERLKLVAESMRVDPAQVRMICEVEPFQVMATEREEHKLMGLWTSKLNSLRVLDGEGNIRLMVKHGFAQSASAAEAPQVIQYLADRHAHWGDAGKVIPAMILVAGARIVDLSGLLDVEQILTLARAELEYMPRDNQVIVIAKLS